LVQNIGLDNTGVHCGADPCREHDTLDNVWMPKNFCKANFMNSKITDSFYKAFCYFENTNKISLTKRLYQKIKKLILYGNK
jgi:hypothetical protein